MKLEGVGKQMGRSGRNQWVQWGTEYDQNTLYEVPKGSRKYCLKSQKESKAFSENGRSMSWISPGLLCKLAEYCRLK